MHPVTEDVLIRAAMGGTARLDSAPAEVKFGSPMYFDHTLGVVVDAAVPYIGASMLFNVPAGDPEGATGQPAPPEPGGTSLQYGLRLHLTTPGDRVFVTGLFEGGYRSYQYTGHVVEECYSGFGYPEGGSCYGADDQDESDHGHGGDHDDGELYVGTDFMLAKHISLLVSAAFVFGSVDVPPSLDAAISADF